MTKVNYKSDFDLILRLNMCAGDSCVDVGWPDYDWTAKFYTRSREKSYIASNIGGVLTNCFNDDGKIHVVFNNHGLDAGTLRVEFSAEIPNDMYPDGLKREVIPSPLGIELTRGRGDCSALIESSVTTQDIDALVTKLLKKITPNPQLSKKRVIVGHFPKIGDNNNQRNYYLTKIMYGGFASDLPYILVNINTKSFRKWLTDGEIGSEHFIPLRNIIELRGWPTSPAYLTRGVSLRETDDGTVLTKIEQLNEADRECILKDGQVAPMAVHTPNVGGYVYDDMVVRYDNQSKVFSTNPVTLDMLLDKLSTPTVEDVLPHIAKKHYIELDENPFATKDNLQIQFRRTIAHPTADGYYSINNCSIWSSKSTHSRVFRARYVARRHKNSVHVSKKASDWAYFSIAYEDWDIGILRIKKIG